MMCEDCLERLSTYIDDELAVSERAQVESHLAECPDCAAELERLRELTVQLRAEPSLEMPAAAAARLDDAVSAALRERQSATAASSGTRATPPGWKKLFQPAFGGLAASMAVLVFAVIVWSGGGVGMNSELLQDGGSGAEERLLPPDNAFRGAKTAGPKTEEAETESSAESKVKELSAPQVLGADDGDSPRVFARDDLLFLSMPDMSAVERDNYEPIEVDGAVDSRMLFDEAARAETITASAAAQIVAGEQEAQLLFAESGRFEDATGVRDAWIVVVELNGAPVAAALTLDGEILYRTD